MSCVCHLSISWQHFITVTLANHGTLVGTDSFQNIFNSTILTIQLAYLSQQHLYILIDTTIAQIGLAIAELQEMANQLAIFAIFRLCHVLAGNIVFLICLWHSAHFANTFRHQDFWNRTTNGKVRPCGKHFATLPFFHTEKKNRRNFWLPHQNELGNVANER